jgi:hypothetical protein
MRLWVASNISLNEKEDEKCIYIIHFYWHPKIDENVIVLKLMM